jgi:hypothetical protein
VVGRLPATGMKAGRFAANCAQPAEASATPGR